VGLPLAAQAEMSTTIGGRAADFEKQAGWKNLATETGQGYCQLSDAHCGKTPRWRLPYLP